VIGTSRSSKSCTLLTERTGNLQLGADAGGAVVHPNAQGEGYYRFAVDPATFHGLLTSTPRLPAREALSFADSIGAAFDAGRLSFADLLAAAQVLANHPDRNAALHLGEKLRAIHDIIADASQRPALERKLVALYKPRLDTMGYDPAAGHYAGDLSSPDSHIRDGAVYALGCAQDPQVAGQARALVLDKRTDIDTTSRIVFLQMADPVTRPATWSWLSSKREPLLERVPGFLLSYFARLGMPLCSPAEREQFDAVLGARLAKASGGELEVARTRETIDDCIALRQAVGPQLQSALAAAR